MTIHDLQVVSTRDPETNSKSTWKMGWLELEYNRFLLPKANFQGANLLLVTMGV